MQKLFSIFLIFVLAICCVALLVGLVKDVKKFIDKRKGDKNKLKENNDDGNITNSGDNQHTC